MSILNVNEIQPVGSGNTITVSAADISASSSALNVSNITATSGNLSGISTVSTTNLTVNGNNYPSSGPLSSRNRAHNGDMRIDQRNDGAAVTVNTSNPFFPVDRYWGYGAPSAGVFTLEQVEDAPAGFRHSVKGTVTTTDSSITASRIYVFEHRIEGNNLQDLKWGTSDAKTVTLSFWVKISQTGTYGGVVHNAAQNRSYAFTWTINAANTWEYKTITIPGDTTGTWVQDNGTGLSIVLISLGIGSTYETSNVTTWESASTFGVSGTTYIIGNLNATFNITGVQFETGTVATPFEHRSYTDELARCQRYYFKLSNSRLVMGYKRHDASSSFGVDSPVPMRVQPTPSLPDGGTFTNFQSNFSTTQTNPNVYEWSESGSRFVFSVDSTWSSTHALVPSWESFTAEFSSEM
tara:strand:+ start:138 stop:1361 length:1224 start_codon:yes stop_codon:yes gene_type:complete